jgi:hypothetical protein
MTRKPGASGKTGARRKAGATAAKGSKADVGADSGLTGSIRSFAGQMMDLAGAAVDASLGVGGLLLRDPKQRQALAGAGRFLRNMRERAGMTLVDVGQAVDLKDTALLELAENGKAALPFEVILRLAAVLARNDPIPFVMNLTNAYSPGVGRMLEMLGIGRLVEHARREHDFITIYRARDAARRLTDAEFKQVMKFVESAFDLALEFVPKEPRRRKPPAADQEPA